MLTWTRTNEITSSRVDPNSNHRFCDQVRITSDLVMKAIDVERVFRSHVQEIILALEEAQRAIDSVMVHDKVSISLPFPPCCLAQ